jgi:hypothetical protein
VEHHLVPIIATAIHELNRVAKQQTKNASARQEMKGTLWCLWAKHHWGPFLNGDRLTTENWALTK